MNTVADVMTTRPICCFPNSTLQEAARIMRECDCGIVPVVEDRNTMHLTGVITDRDIVVRSVAEGRNPTEARVADFLSDRVDTLGPEDSLEECRQLMESRKIRRVPIVDPTGTLVGIVSMADLAEQVRGDRLGQTLAEVSEPDTRQLYSEVSEHNRSRDTVTPIHDPTEESRIILPRPEQPGGRV